jgi:hypothetical protein
MDTPCVCLSRSSRGYLDAVGARRSTTIYDEVRHQPGVADLALKWTSAHHERQPAPRYGINVCLRGRDDMVIKTNGMAQIGLATAEASQAVSIPGNSPGPGDCHVSGRQGARRGRIRRWLWRPACCPRDLWTLGGER